MVAHLINENDSSLKAPFIKLYTEGTPNGRKISIMLELLKQDYNVRRVSIMNGEQKEKWFLNLNPNGRIPVLTDVDASGKELTISESGAILLYLVDKYDKENKFSYAYGTPEYWKMVEILMFQMSGLGPMQGQGIHFNVLAKEKVPYGIERYIGESRRLYGVLEEILGNTKTGFLVGDHLTIADVACWPWILFHHKIDVDINEFPNLAKWLDTLGKLEGFDKGKDIPVPLPKEI